VGEAQIVIAAQDIARGSEIPADGIILSPFPADFVVETMVTDVEQVIGRRARMDIARGVPITERMLTQQAGDLLGTGSEAAIAIPPGMTAIAVPMDRFSGVAYAIQDGDQVDVIISMLMVDVDPEFQTLLPDHTAILVGPNGEVLTGTGATTVETGAEGTSATSPEPLPLGRVDEEETTGQQVYLLPVGAQRPRLVSQRLITNATVLHVGDFALPEEEEEEPATEQAPAGAPAQQQQQVVVIEKPTIVTLIVAPQDALALKWALEAGGDLTLTLRAPNDDVNEATTSVTLQFLIDTYNIAVPSKLPYGTEPRLEADSLRWQPSQSSSAPAPVTE
jgi:pilus assembly protein CpaB